MARQSSNPFSGDPAPEAAPAPAPVAPAPVSAPIAAAIDTITTAASRAEASPAKPDPTAGMLEVFDLLAVDAPREHEPVRNFRVPLSARKATLLPAATALKFLCADSFVVRRPGTGVDGDPTSGERINPMPTVDRNAVSGAVILKPGQLVATYDELHDTALRNRVAQLPGSDPAFIINAGREALIGFMQNHDAMQRKRISRDSDATGGDPSLAPVENLDSLIRLPDPRRQAAVA